MQRLAVRHRALARGPEDDMPDVRDWTWSVGDPPGQVSGTGGSRCRSAPSI